MGIPLSKNYKGLPGRPDIVLTKYRIAIFVIVNFPWKRLGNTEATIRKKEKIQIIGLRK